MVATQADGTPGGHTLGLYVMVSHTPGLCESVATRIEQLLPLPRVYEPSKQRHDTYADYFTVYLALSERFRDDFARLARISSNNG